MIPFAPGFFRPASADAITPIEYVGVKTSQNGPLFISTVTGPGGSVSPLPGDMVIVVAAGPTTQPTVPAAFSSVSCTHPKTSVGWMLLSSGDISGGISAWTNSNVMVCTVYRNALTVPSSSENYFNPGGSEFATFPALSLTYSDDTSWVVCPWATASSSSTNPPTAPTGITVRGSVYDFEAVGQDYVSIYDSNSAVSAWSEAQSSTSVSENYVILSVEISPYQ